MQDTLGEKPGEDFMTTAKNNMIEVKKEDGVAILTINNPPIMCLTQTYSWKWKKFLMSLKKRQLM